MPIVAAARGRVGWLASLLCILLVVPGSAIGQVSTPTPSPTIVGEVVGGRTVGAELTLGIDVVMPGGWQSLRLIEVEFLIAGEVVERIVYDIENVKLAVGGEHVVAGTGGEATGSYVRIRGSAVVVTTGGAYLSLRLRASIVRGIPQGLTFRLSAIGDRGEIAAVTRRIETPPAGGLTWETLLTGVLVALLLGGILGNTLASRRRVPLRVSVYGSIQRRIDDERTTAAPPR